MTTAGTSFVLNMPSSVLAGELLLAGITLNSSASFTAGNEFGASDSGVPAGWAKIFNRSNTTSTEYSLHVFKRIAGGTVGQVTTDPSTYTWTIAQSVTGSGSIIAFSDADTSGFDGTVNNGVVSPALSMSADLTMSSGGDAVVAFAGMDSGSTIVFSAGPSGFTERWGYSQTTVGQRNACASLTGATSGPLTVSWTANSTIAMWFWAAGIRAAPVGSSIAYGYDVVIG